MPVAAPEEITITRDKWRILTMIDGCTSVGEIVLRAGIGRQRALQMIVELVDEGLAELREPEPSR
jgi:hypothetical protein